MAISRRLSAAMAGFLVLLGILLWARPSHQWTAPQGMDSVAVFEHLHRLRSWSTRERVSEGQAVSPERVTVSAGRAPTSITPVDVEASVNRTCLSGMPGVGRPPEEQLLERMEMWSSSSTNTPSVLCYVLALSKDLTPIQAVGETWGPGCDELVFFLDKVNPKIDQSIQQVELDVFGDGILSDKAAVINKSMAAIGWLAQHRAHKYDWFGQFNTDSYVFMPNLREYLLEFDHTDPFLIGRRFTVGEMKEISPGEWATVARGHGSNSTEDGHPSGRKQHNFVAGSGYVLSREALTQVACTLGGTCPGSEGPPVEIPRGNWEDVFLSTVMAKHLNVEPFDTRDECGAERFHPFHPGVTPFAIKTTPWYREYSYSQAVGFGCCSVRPIMFHGFNAGGLRQFHKLVKRVVKQ